MKRHETLLRLVEEKGLGWAQTNEYGKAAKAHFLQMRREGLVNYTSGDDNSRIRDLIIRGPDKNAYFYTVTVKGLMFLSKEYEDNESVHDAMRELAKGILSEDSYWISEFKLRSKKS